MQRLKVNGVPQPPPWWKRWWCFLVYDGHCLHQDGLEVFCCHCGYEPQEDS